MNGKIESIRATAVVKHTGIVWGAEFPYPNPNFLKDMGWQVYETASGRRLEWEPYGIRKLPNGMLEMRFRDRGWTNTPETADQTTITVELVSPMP